MAGKKKLGIKVRECVPWVIAALGVLSSNWAAEALSSDLKIWLKEWPAVASRLGDFYILLFVAVVILLYRFRGTFFRPHTRYLSNETAEKRKHLVLFLSSLQKDIEESGGIPSLLHLTNDIDADIGRMEAFKRSNRPWSWEMPLRAIRYHLGTLETVTLVCSRESICQAGLFLNICARYDRFKNLSFSLLARTGRRLRLHSVTEASFPCSHEGFDFESFDELSRAIWQLLRKFGKKGYFEDDIMIDITGGQKPTSIVGASVTFNRRVKAQYIQTNSPWDVLSYDVELASSDTGKLGI